MYQHFTRLPECWDYCTDYFPYIQRPTVMDRFHLSELAYAHARGEVSKLTKCRLDLLRAKLADVGHYVVLILATPDRLRIEHQRQGEDEMYPFDKVCAANEWFMSHASSRQDRMFDALYTIDTQRPDEYPSSNYDFVQHIVGGWMGRQRAISQIRERTWNV